MDEHRLGRRTLALPMITTAMDMARMSMTTLTSLTADSR